MKKIYSILVAYNPDLEELNQAVERLKKQTDIVIVCNNSDYDVEFEGEQVKVFNFGENLGIAKAQSIGMKWAFENGADFILQMDQDSIPHDDLVEKLLECYEELTEKGYKVGLVGSQDYDKDTKYLSKAKIDRGTTIESECYIKINQVISSGSLIPIETYKIIGGMDDDFGDLPRAVRDLVHGDDRGLDDLAAHTAALFKMNQMRRGIDTGAIAGLQGHGFQHGAG